MQMGPYHYKYWQEYDALSVHSGALSVMLIPPLLPAQVIALRWPWTVPPHVPYALFEVMWFSQLGVLVMQLLDPLPCSCGIFSLVTHSALAPRG